VADISEACRRATDLIVALNGIHNEHLVRQHDAIALANGTLALVLDEVLGGSLANVLGARGPLGPGETITTVAPLFGAIADLHAIGIVHGNLGPEKILYSDDGRPQLGGLGSAYLRGRRAVPGGGPSGFVAPELAEGGDPSPASDVYAMAAIGWFCLTGAPPGSAAACPTLSSVQAEGLPKLVQVLTSCLGSNPAARPSARVIAAEVFDASSAEPVRLGSGSDPASEITRRIRQVAVSAPAEALSATGNRSRHALVFGAVALVVAMALGGGATWVLRLRPVAAAQMAVIRPTARPSKTPAAKGAPFAQPVRSSRGVPDVMTAPDSPRTGALALLQALVDARALAYVARDPALLDLVYAPGAVKAVNDRANIATAFRNGATYLGLEFVVKDVAFLDATSDVARIRATIVTLGYQTGQPDGRKVAHQPEVVGPSVFTVKLAADGWRILSMTMG
jgi:eukaryotic-like serine/threonine-protein kinase